MNNETIHEFMIKLRGDNVYDLYVDGAWVDCRGYHERIVEVLSEVMKGVVMKREN